MSKCLQFWKFLLITTFAFFLVICAKQLITNNFASTHAKLVTFGIMGIYLCAIRTGVGLCGFFFQSHATWFKVTLLLVGTK